MRWKCPTCKRWVDEPITMRCQDCQDIKLARKADHDIKAADLRDLEAWQDRSAGGE